MARKSDAVIKISGDVKDAEQSLEGLKKKGTDTFKKISSEAEKSNKDIANSYKKLGVVTEANIKKANKELRDSFKKIKESGTASADEIKRAHIAMTAKIKENNRKLKRSNKGIISSFGNIRGAILPITIAITALGLAINKVFDTAKLGAKLRAQELAFRNLADSNGADGERIIKTLKQVSKDTVTNVSIIESANKAILLGIPANKLEELLKIARAASKATGDSIQKSFEDITIGIGRQSRLILDNLGLIVSVGVANEKYAEQLGITASELTDSQRKQAFLNRTIEAGRVIIKGVGEDVVNTSDVISQVTTKLSNFGQAIAKFFSKVLASTIIKIGNFFTRAALGITFLQRELFSVTNNLGLTDKNIDVINNTIKIFEERLQKADRRLKSVNRSTKELTEAEKKLNAKVKEHNDREKELESTIKQRAETAKKAAEDNLEATESQIDAQETNIKQLKTITSLSKNAVKIQKKLVEDLKDELEDSEEFVKSLLKLVQETDRELAKRGKTVSKSADIDIDFAFEDLEKARKLIESGDFKSAKTLLGDIAKVSEGVVKTEGVSKRIVEDAKFVTDEVIKMAKEIVEIDKAALKDPLEKLFVTEAIQERNTEIEFMANVALQNAIKKAEKLKKIFEETKIPVVATQRPQPDSKRLRHGGSVGDGFGGGDTVPILGENGEFMLNKETVRNVGEANIAALNRSNGGILKSGSAQPSSTVNLNLQVGGKQVALSGSKNEVSKLVKQIKNINIKQGRYEGRF